MTYELAKHLFDYDPSTGVLTWRVNRGNSITKGSQAGSIHKGRRTNYLKVRYKRVDYKVHRICWLMAYGAWPTNEIDHEDGDGLNNRIGNLRDVTTQINQQNIRIPTSNTSGVVGVSWYKNYQKWMARITVNQKDITLGYFNTIDEAADARKAANLKHGFHELHGTEKSVTI